MILLDTHVLLWFVDDDPRLGKIAKAKVEAAFETDEAVLAAISLWETGMLVARGHVTLAMSPARLIERAVSDGLSIIDMDGNIALDAGVMPREIHGDPCDRIIMATARTLSCPLATADRRLLDYGAAGWLQVVDARH